MEYFSKLQQTIVIFKNLKRKNLLKIKEKFAFALTKLLENKTIEAIRKEPLKEVFFLNSKQLIYSIYLSCIIHIYNYTISLTTSKSQ